MSELTKRILVAVPAAAALLYVTWLGGWIFKAVVILAGLQTVRETIYLFKITGLQPDRLFPYSIALWVLLLPDLPHAFQIGLAIFILFIILQIHKSSEESIRSFASTLFCGIYAPIGLLAFVMIRSLTGGEEGFMLAVSLLLMVWGNDVFAYFGGRSFGKHRMAPSISPKKTWEGFVSGILGAVVGFLIALYLVPFKLSVSMLQALPAILLISFLGPVGDLTASKLKRAGHVKDTSDILPGHGGLFDRLDALILAAPAYYLYLYTLRILGYASF